MTYSCVCVDDMISCYQIIAVAFCIHFSVTGYDTLVAPYDLDRALRKHFASCGRIRQCCISIDPERGYVSR